MNARILAGRLLLILILLFMHTQSALAAPPYKLTISGPGLDSEIEIWLASDHELLAKLDSGLQPDQTIELPNDVDLISYDLVWYFGRCWVELRPCTEDPAGAVIHRSQYVLDTTSGQGYVSHQSDLGAWGGYGEEWYDVPDDFDRAIQRLLIELYAGIRA
jgi:hypothetical protein